VKVEEAEKFHTVANLRLALKTALFATPPAVTPKPLLVLRVKTSEVVVALPV
jgi:hypothetical protein